MQGGRLHMEGGRIVSSGAPRVVAAWVVTLLWNGVSWFVALRIVPQLIGDGNRGAWFALAFPVVGIGFLVYAARATARWLKFGTSLLELSPEPARLGGELRGRLIAPLGSPPHGVRLVLSCLRTDHRRDDSSGDVVWLEEKVVPAEEVRREGRETVVPVVFALPTDAPATVSDTRAVSISWKLHVSASVPGVDYQAAFEVRVEERGASAADVRDARGAPVPLAPVAATFDPRAATVRVRPTADGLELYFGPGRNPGAAGAFGVMFGVFGGAAYGLSLLEIPRVFEWVCGAFALLMLFIVLDLWLRVSYVTISKDVITVRRSFLGIGRTLRIPAADVLDAFFERGMAQGETVLQSPRLWYDIKVSRKGGRPITLGSNVASKREAEWLVDATCRALGRERRQTGTATDHPPEL